MPSTGEQLSGSSGVVAAAPAVSTVTSAVDRLAYLSGFSVSGLGATVGIQAAITITGLLGGTVNYGYPVPAGVGVAGPPLSMVFDPPLQASGTNVDIVVTVASFGAGNVGASCMAYGFLSRLGEWA